MNIMMIDVHMCLNHKVCHTTNGSCHFYAKYVMQWQLLIVGFFLSTVWVHTFEWTVLSQKSILKKKPRIDSGGMCIFDSTIEWVHLKCCSFISFSNRLNSVLNSIKCTINKKTNRKIGRFNFLFLIISKPIASSITKTASAFCIFIYNWYTWWHKGNVNER